MCPHQVTRSLFPLQVIQACHSCPKAIEVVVNAYEHIRWNIKWRRAIPDDDLEVNDSLSVVFTRECCQMSG